jgi:hypothetical protein
VKYTKEQIDKAVNWWGEVLKNPKYDNGDKSDSGELGMMLGMMARKEITHTDIEKFKDNLRKIMEQKEPYGSANLDLSCDYYPCQELVEATKGTSIEDSNFPWKTDMIFKQEFINHHLISKVLVSYGYSAPLEEI